MTPVVVADWYQYEYGGPYHMVHIKGEANWGNIALIIANPMHTIAPPFNYHAPIFRYNEIKGEFIHESAVNLNPVLISGYLNIFAKFGPQGYEDIECFPKKSSFSKWSQIGKMSLGLEMQSRMYTLSTSEELPFLLYAFSKRDIPIPSPHLPQSDRLERIKTLLRTHNYYGEEVNTRSLELLTHPVIAHNGAYYLAHLAGTKGKGIKKFRIISG